MAHPGAALRWWTAMGPLVFLRDVLPDDFPIFFDHQRDPDATKMAAFPPRERAAFMGHWTHKVLGDPEVKKKTIVFSGSVAGHVVSFSQGGERLVGYWIGRDHWGKGVATAALREFLKYETSRPLRARVADGHVASCRVLEKCGFSRIGAGRGTANGAEVDELVYVLR